MAKKPSKGSHFTVDLAKSVMRSAHAAGGVAHRKHFEGGGDANIPAPVDNTPKAPTESDYTAAINKIFQQDFGRNYNPDTDSWWLDQLKSGKESLDNLSKLETDIKSGATGADKAASTYLPTLQNLYQQDFGRAYNPATDSYWLQQLGSGAEDPANLAKDVIAGAQGRDKLYYNTYNTPQQTQVVQPVQQNPSGYVGIPTGRTDVTPFVGTTTTTPTTTQTTTAPTTVTPSATTTQSQDPYAAVLDKLYMQDFGRHYNPATDSYWSQQLASGKEDPANLAKDVISGAQGADLAYYKSFQDPGVAQNYENTPWQYSIKNVQNYMSPNPMLGYQFNAPNLISAPLMNQYLANSGGPGVNSPTQNIVNPQTAAAPAAPVAAQQPAYAPPAPDMSAYQNAYNAVMTNPTYVGTTTPSTDSTKTTTTPTTTTNTTATKTTPQTDYTSTLNQLYQQDFGRAYNPATDSYWAQQLASGKENPANLAQDIISGAQGADASYYWNNHLPPVKLQSDTAGGNTATPTTTNTTPNTNVSSSINTAPTPSVWTPPNVNTSTPSGQQAAIQSALSTTYGGQGINAQAGANEVNAANYLVSQGLVPPSTATSDSPTLEAVRSNPAAESALQGAAALGLPGFGVYKQGGRIKKNKPSTGAFIKKALMVVSTNAPKRSKRKG